MRALRQLFMYLIFITGCYGQTTISEVKQVPPTFKLFWDKPVEDDIDRFIVSYGISTGKYDKTFETLQNVHLFEKVEPGRYYLVVYALNKKGLKSPASTELIFDVVKPTRFINVQMSLDAGITYNSIGKVPYPKIKGQKYKTNILTLDD